MGGLLTTRSEREKREEGWKVTKMLAALCGVTSDFVWRADYIGASDVSNCGMSNGTTTCCMSARVAKPIHADPAVAFNPNPVLADLARKHRLDWWDDGCQ